MAKTVFLIHGMWGSAWYWQGYREFFEARGYQVLTPTLRHHDGHPDDPPHPDLGTTSLLDYADDLEAEIRALPELPVIIGHSMGGLLAQILCERQLARAAVLLCPAPPAGINALKPSVIRSFWSVQTQWSFWNKPMKLSFDEACYAMLNLLPETEQRIVYNQFLYESGQAAFEIGYWPFDMERASRVLDAQVRCPLLVVAGGQDRITPATVVRKVAGKYAGVSTYMEFPDHSHWMVAEPGWQEIAGCVEAWIARKT